MNKVRFLLSLIISFLCMVEISKASNSDEIVFIPLITQDSLTVVRQVNVPFSTNSRALPLGSRAIFWFGEVDSTSNYTDVRIAYTNEAVHLSLSIFDQWLFHDPTPNPNELSDWDAATLLLDLDLSSGSLPDLNSYKFVGQLSGMWQNRDGYQAAYRGNGAGWIYTSIPFHSTAIWRGDGINNGATARGWILNFEIPFSSLGLSGPPKEGSEWSMALLVSDRDDVIGSPGPVQSWPEAVDGSSSSTWGILRFGSPTYSHPPASSWSTVTIQHELNGSVVRDAHVGGHTICGEPYNPDFFDGWGEANYAGYDQINVQNQADVADWPCFSKFFLTFPLDLVPPGKIIVSARLRLHLFGNSEPSQAFASNIQALTVGEDWNEANITWNNAPLALENIANTKVEPVLEFPGWPGVPYDWDVSRAVAQVYNSLEPLRLVLYSADGPMHSGKYFSSSDTGNWNQEARPTLEVVWGKSSDFVSESFLSALLSN